METVTRIALALVIVLAAATLLAYAFQRSLIYYPAHARLETLAPLAEREDLLAWRDAEQRFIGWRTRTGQGIPVLMLHGNAGHALHRSDTVARLRDAGVGSPIYILEYPGYGARPGTPTEENLVAAATDAIDLLGRPIILLGESLGSGVACQAAGRRPKLVTGLVLVTPYDSLVTVARKHYPFIPAGVLLKDRYQSTRALQSFHGPLAVIVAEEDTIIPPDSGRRLFESYHGPRKLSLVPRAGHNEVLWKIGNAELLSAFEFAGGR
jgi:pimeloyl-ACP methyl ester carboxylesterase